MLNNKTTSFTPKHLSKLLMIDNSYKEMSKNFYNKQYLPYILYTHCNMHNIYN